MRVALGLPRGAHVPILISVGYPAAGEPREKKLKPLDEIRRYAE